MYVWSDHPQLSKNIYGHEHKGWLWEPKYQGVQDQNKN